jgi:hypothetical protein
MSETEGGAPELRDAVEMLRRGEALLARRVLASVRLVADPRWEALLRELWSFDLSLRRRVAEDIERFGRADDHRSWLARVDLLRMLLLARVEDLEAHLRHLGGGSDRVSPRDPQLDLYDDETRLVRALRVLSHGGSGGAADDLEMAYAAARRQLASTERMLESPRIVREMDVAEIAVRGAAVEDEVWKASPSDRLEGGANVLEPSVTRVAEDGVEALLADRGLDPSVRGSDAPYPSRAPAEVWRGGSSDRRVNWFEQKFPKWLECEPALVHRSAPTPRASPPPDSSELPEAGPTDSPIVRRTPHMDLSAAGPLAPGARVAVRVYADCGPAADGELSAPVEVEMPAGTDRVDIRVLFVPSGHFREGPSHRSLAIVRGRPDTERLTFFVTVRSAEELLALGGELAPLDEAELMAAFDHRGRPAGFVTRRVKIDITPPDPASEPAPAKTTASSSPAPAGRPPTLATSADGQLPDMVVRILPHPNHNGRQFLCSVVAPALGAEGAGDAPEEWNLPHVTSELVQLYMKDFVQTDPGARVAALRGAGKQFFDAAPENFKRAYWKLVDAGTPPRSIAVVSVEPHIPWELMLPEREPGAVPRRMKPLGVEAMIGRWTRAEGTSGKQAIVLSSSRVIAPTYSRKPLAHAQKEAELVTSRFPGSVIRPADVTTIGSEVGAAGDLTLLHFTCHGSAEGSLQTLILDNDYRLSSTVVSGMEELETLFERGRTMVFLNACEVGRTNTGLAGVGGFASTFIELGAVAVIAPLWAVRDSVAFEVAKAVYEGIMAEPARPFAEILRELRARAYERGTGEDTYAAYCFYGDPLARLVPGP